MRILIFGLCRTGSKRFRDILATYAQLATGRKKIFSPHEPKYKTPFTFMNGKWTRDTSILPMSHSQLLDHYLIELDNTDEPIVMNFHYYEGIGEQEMELATRFDKVFVLKRKDTFQQILSLRLADIEHCYIPDDKQLAFIESAKRSGGVKLDEYLFEEDVTNYLSMYNDTVNGAREVFSEDFFSIKDVDDFYQLTDLPPVEGFDSINSVYGKEFTGVKEELITNYENLQRIFQEVKKKVFQEVVKP